MWRNSLYINAVINNYELVKVPVNEKLRAELKSKSIQELEVILRKYKDLHNNSDLDTTKRASSPVSCEAPCLFGSRD